MFSTPPKAQQPGGESGELKDPGETKPPLARAGEIISGGGDDGVNFQKWDGDDKEEEKEGDGDMERQPSRGRVDCVGDLAQDQFREHCSQRNGRGEGEGGYTFDRGPGWAEAETGEGEPSRMVIPEQRRWFFTAMERGLAGEKGDDSLEHDGRYEEKGE